MKKFFMLYGLLLLLPLWTSAQLKEVIINIYGGFDLVLEVGKDQYVTVTDEGDIVGMDIRGNAGYYDDFWSYRAGKVKRVGAVNFDYYDDFWDYSAGKVKQIGQVSFDYHNDFFEEKKGKLRRVGTVSIDYYNDFYPERAGKVSDIGNIRFDYYTKTFSGARGGSHEDVTGLLKSVNTYTYSYLFRSPGRGSGAYAYRPREHDRKKRPVLATGERRIEIRGVVVLIIDRIN